MKIKYFNRKRLPADEEELYHATYCSSLHELLGCSDVFSVNCPLNSETTGMISRAEFAIMKDGVYFVNTARGAIADEHALIDALESGKVRRAGLDVFDGEPNIHPYFLESDKCVIQPHLGGLTDGAFAKAEMECFENIRNLFETKRPIAPVNSIPAMSTA